MLRIRVVEKLETKDGFVLGKQHLYEYRVKDDVKYTELVDAILEFEAEVLIENEKRWTTLSVYIELIHDRHEQMIEMEIKKAVNLLYSVE